MQHAAFTNTVAICKQDVAVSNRTDAGSCAFYAATSEFIHNFAGDGT